MVAFGSRLYVPLEFSLLNFSIQIRAPNTQEGTTSLLLAVTTQRNWVGESFEISGCSSESPRLVLEDEFVRLTRGI